MNEIKLGIEMNQLQENSKEDPRGVTGVNQATLGIFSIITIPDPVPFDENVPRKGRRSYGRGPR